PQTAAAAPTSVTHPDSHNARRLTELLPAGYPDHACTPSDTSTEDRTVLTCDQNTDPGGPQAATYTLFSTPDALPAALQQVIDKTAVVTCPGRIQSPVLCPTGVSNPVCGSASVMMGAMIVR
ncbi:MAG: hypothetical protein WBV64_18410, partial [Mycobacterium sp.]